MPKLVSAIVILVGLYLLGTNAQTVKVGFFAGGEFLDGGYVQGAYTGLQDIIAIYGSRIQVGYQGPDDNMTVGSLLAGGANYPFPPQFVGYDLIACVGFQFELPVQAWAKQQPGTRFVIIDQSISAKIDNLLAVIFAEDQAGYMAGVGAGILSKTKVVAMVGGFESSPPVRKYITGFVNGIQNTCPECKVIIKYVFSFSDPVAGYNMAKFLVDQYNADVIFPVAGFSGYNILKFLPSAYPSIRTIGVDTDAFDSTFLGNLSDPGVDGLAFSVGKGLGVAIKSVLTTYLDKAVFTPGQVLQTASSGGIQVFKCYKTCSELNPQTNPTMVAFFDKLKNNELSSGVSSLDGIPLAYTDPTKLNTWQQFQPAYRPADSIWALLTTIQTDSFGGTAQLFAGAGADKTWIWTPTSLVWEEGPSGGPAVIQSAIVGYQSSAFIFGGQDTSSIATNKLWQLNYTSFPQQWVEITAPGAPAARQGHTAAIYNDQILIFGGQDSSGRLLNDLYSYSISSGTWTALPNKLADNSDPSERLYHASTVIGDVLYVYGGKDRSLSPQNDIQGYDLTAKQWFNPNSTDIQLPALQFHTAGTIGTSMIVVGGSDGGSKRPPTLMRIDLDRYAPVVRVTINATFPAVGLNLDNPNCPSTGNSTTGGITLAGMTISQVGTDSGHVWLFGGSNDDGVRLSAMLYNNFNKTLDIAQASKRKLKFVDWNEAPAIIVMVLAAIGILACVVVAVVLIIFVRTPVVSYSSPASAFVILVGLAVLFSAVYTFPGKLNEAQCGLRPWLVGGGAILLLGPMLAKLYRLFKILENTSLVQTAIRTLDLLLYAGVLIAIEVLFLIIWTAVDRLKPKIVNGNGSSQAVIICACDHFWAYMGVQLGYFAILIVAGIFFAFRVRSIASKVFWKDATFVSYTVYLSAISVLLLCLISAFLYKFYLGGFLALLLVYIICISVALVILFAVKLFVIFFRKAQNENSSAAASSINSEFKPPDDFEEPL